MSQIGYAASYEKKSPVSIIKKKDIILSFDSKDGIDSQNGIDTKDINHHLIVLGTTGTGKTRSVVLPSIMSLLKKGHCGLIIDIKGNLREQVMALAKSVGRSADLVEFGNTPTATPLNLLNNYNSAEVYSTIKTLTLQSFSGDSHNKDFHVRGIKQSTECFQFLHILEQHKFIKGATLASIANLINNPKEASELYETFKNKIYDSKNNKYKKLVSSIDSNSFHIFKYKENDSVPKNSKNSTYFEQLNYVLEGQRTAFKEFLDVPGIIHGFAKSGADGLDMTKMIKQNKIVILRFEPGSGSIGVSLARKLMEEYYKSIYTLGTMEAAKQPSFICIDEFQDVAVLDSSKFSDIAFISQAREFNASFIASTQSVSALACRGNVHSSVDAFISNCNTKIIFYSDDPKTQEIVDRYELSVKLTQLKTGTAFVTQYNSNIREHSQSIESFNNSFEATNKILAQYKEKINVSDKNKQFTDETESISDIIELIEENEKQKSDAGVRAGKSHTATRTKQTTSCKPRSLLDIINEEISMKKTSKKQESVIVANKEDVVALKNKYKDCFTKHGIPVGWYPSLEKAINFIAHTGVPLDIAYFGICNHALQGYSPQATSGTPHAAILIAVNSLLKITKYICPLCGEHFDTENYIRTSKNSNSINFCTNCADKFSIKPYIKTDKVNYDKNDVNNEGNENNKMPF